MFKFFVVTILGLFPVAGLAANSPCKEAASILSRGVLASATTFEKGKIQEKPRFRGLNHANGATALYSFTLDINGCLIDYNVEFDSEYCIVEDVKVTSFCG